MFALASTPIEQIIWLAQPVIMAVLFVRLRIQHNVRLRRPAWARMSADAVIEAATRALQRGTPETLVPPLAVAEHPAIGNGMCWRVVAVTGAEEWTAVIHDDTGLVDIPAAAAQPPTVQRRGMPARTYRPSPSGRPSMRLRF